MKSLKTNTRIVTIALVTVFTMVLSAPVFANNEKNEAPAELKYLGEYKGQPVFELTFNSDSESEFTVAIIDEYKNVLYKDVVKSGTTSRKYMLDTYGVDNPALKFEVTSRKTNKTVTYEINKKSHVVEDIVINQVK